MKKLFSLIISIIITFPTIPSVTAYECNDTYATDTDSIYIVNYDDVPKSHWAYQYIMDMSNKGILSGYGDGYFGPENTITRAQFATIMCNAAKLETYPVSDTSYVDVSTSDWFAQSVEAAKYYLSGYIYDGKKYYKPNENAVREDIAVALVKLKGYDVSNYNETELKTKFTDWQSISKDARKYVYAAVKNNLIDGYDDNTFRGQASITRAEAATLFWKSYQFGNDNKVFEKEVFETIPPAPTIKPTTSPVPTEDISVEQKLELSLNIPNTQYTLKPNESIEFIVNIGYNIYGEYEPIITGNTEIISSSTQKSNNMTTKNIYTTKELAPGKYELTFSITDEIKTHTKTVNITVIEPEPEYLYELKTIGTGVTDIETMIAFSDGAFFMSDDVVYEVTKDGNTVNVLLDGNDMDYLGGGEISKAEKSYLKTFVRYLGYDPLSDERYCILSQTIGNCPILLYNIDTGEYIDITKIMRSKEVERYSNLRFAPDESFLLDEFGNIVISQTIIDYVNNKVYGFQAGSQGSCTQLFVDNNIYIPSKSMGINIYKYNKRTGLADEKLDYFIPEKSNFISADNKYFYFRTDSGNIYRVDTNGDSELLFGVDDIDNVDGRLINIGSIKYLTSVISNGVIYYWDVNYNSIRQLSHK